MKPYKEDLPCRSIIGHPSPPVPIHVDLHFKLSKLDFLSLLHVLSKVLWILSSYFLSCLNFCFWLVEALKLNWHLIWFLHATNVCTTTTLKQRLQIVLRQLWSHIAFSAVLVHLNWDTYIFWPIKWIKIKLPLYLGIKLTYYVKSHGILKHFYGKSWTVVIT